MRMLLGNRLAIIDWRKEHPEVADGDVVPPIVIVGQARTGTTILYDLLAQDPATRVAAHVGGRPAGPAARDRDLRHRPAHRRGRRDPLGRRPAHARLPRRCTRWARGSPQECVRITASDFRSVIFPTQYRVPSYGRWCDVRGRHGAGVPLAPHVPPAPAVPPPGRRRAADRWLLKSPAHIWCLDALLAEYPDALLVQTHRDPLRIIASLVVAASCTLRGMTQRRPAAPRDRGRVGRVHRRRARPVGDRARGRHGRRRTRSSTCTSTTSWPTRSRRSARSTTPRARAHAPRARARMRDVPRRARPGRARPPRYSFADTGLDDGEWRERTRRYQEHFGVPSESSLRVIPDPCEDR